MPNYRKQHIRQFRYLLKNFEEAVIASQEYRAAIHSERWVPDKLSRDNCKLQKEMLLTFFKNVIGETSND